MARVASLDLLRGLAALTVAIPHFFVYNLDQPGVLETISVLAVEVFFVLSGFVLAPQILFCAERGSIRTLLRFLTRRWMRTLPPFVLSLLLISVLFNELPSDDFWRYLFFVQNLWRQINANDYFSIAWSLSIEEWFYVCFPVFFLLLSGGLGPTGRHGPLAIALVWIVTITLLRSLFADFDDWGAEVRRVVLFRIDSIAYGFLLFIFMERILVRGSCAVLFLLLVLSSVAGFEAAEHAAAGNLAAKQLYPFAAASFGMLALAFFRAASPAVERFAFLRRLSLFLGRVSYSIYLFHLAFLYLVHQYCAAFTPLAQFALYVALTVAYATFLFYFFERPILAARPRLE